MPDESGDMLSTQQAAERLGVSVIRVRQWITSGRLPASKVGRDYVLHATDVDAFERRKVGRPRANREEQSE